MTYLEKLQEQYGAKLGVQPLEIVANTLTGNYTFPDGNSLIRDCLLLGVTARAISGTLYSPLGNTLLPSTVTNQAYLTIKCGASDIISYLPYEVITDMEDQGLVHPLHTQGLSLDKSFVFVPQASTVMSGQTGKSFLLNFYGLFN